jgi:hypothetical protein
MKLNKKQTRNLVARFWIFEGRLPPGTNNDSFDGVTMVELQLDDPPVPGSPGYEHKKYADMLTGQFNKLSIAVPGILEVLEDDAKTMAELCQHCFENQKALDNTWK